MMLDLLSALSYSLSAIPEHFWETDVFGIADKEQRKFYEETFSE